MRTQADEKMKLAEQMIVENRRKTAKTIHTERSLSKTTNDKLKYLATTALFLERSDNHAEKVKNDLMIDNLKGSHLTQVIKMKSKHQDVSRKSVVPLRDVRQSYAAKHQDANRKSVEVL